MIKNKIKFGLFVLSMFSIFGLVGFANAADLSWTADTTVTIGSADYTIESGSEATSLEIGATTLTVTVPASSTFTLISSDKYKLNNDSTINYTCGSTTSYLALTGLRTAIITPSTNICSGEASSSGGYVRSVIPAVPATPATPAVPGVSTAVPAAPATPGFQARVFFANRIHKNSPKLDIKNLQIILSYNLGQTLKIDGMFGPKTLAAVKAFQAAKKLAVDGIIGPKTLAALNAVGL